MTHWAQATATYVHSQRDPQTGGYRSAIDGPPTGYATAYALLTLDYLGQTPADLDRSLDFLQNLQDPDTGWFVGPELPPANPPSPAPGTDRVQHDREHLLHHLTCTVVPALAQFGRQPRHPLAVARRYTDLDFLQTWLDQRDLGNAWLEGNNLLFAGQLLLHLRDHEQEPAAAAALDHWFDWHDRHLDPQTGVWGTDRGSDVRAGIYGGYHQLILYYDLRPEIKHHEALVDQILSIQHPDGGFSKTAGGGACEDVDAIDILVNLYKRYDYRRPEIRVALRRCLKLLWSVQNPDGGFSYKRGRGYVHMGMESTRNRQHESGMFPTWFRVHTLALIAQVLTDEPAITEEPLGFSKAVSMGWHDQDSIRPPAKLSLVEYEEEKSVRKRQTWTQLSRRLKARIQTVKNKARRTAGKVKRRFRR